MVARMATSPILTQRRRRLPAGVVRRAALGTALIALTIIVGLIAAHAAGLPRRVRASGESRSYGLPIANVDMQVQRDGSVRVVERITFDFTGQYSGAFRDIPLRDGDSIDQVVVCEPPGASSPFGAAPTVPDVSALDPATAKLVLDTF
jgi:hypothetical protein